MVALDHASIALADRSAGNIDLLPDLEYINTKRAANLEVGEPLGQHTEFLQYRASLDASLGEMPGGGLVNAACTALAICNLYRAIAVGLGSFDLNHAIVRHVNHGHRNGITIVGKHARHADLPSNQSQTHVFTFWF